MPLLLADPTIHRLVVFQIRPNRSMLMLCRRTKEAKMPVQGFSIRNLLFGFIAGAIAVVVVHQSVVYALVATGMLPATSIPWNLKPYGPLGVPTVVNTMFWGGLWGPSSA